MELCLLSQFLLSKIQTSVINFSFIRCSGTNNSFSMYLTGLEQSYVFFVVLLCEEEKNCFFFFGHVTKMKPNFSCVEEIDNVFISYEEEWMLLFFFFMWRRVNASFFLWIVFMFLLFIYSFFMRKKQFLFLVWRRQNFFYVKTEFIFFFLVKTMYIFSSEENWMFWFFFSCEDDRFFFWCEKDNVFCIFTFCCSHFRHKVQNLYILKIFNNMKELFCKWFAHTVTVFVRVIEIKFCLS